MHKEYRESLIDLQCDLECRERIAFDTLNTIGEVSKLIVTLNHLLTQIEDGGPIPLLREAYHAVLTRLNTYLVYMGIDPEPPWHEFNLKVEMLINRLEKEKEDADRNR